MSCTPAMAIEYRIRLSKGAPVNLSDSPITDISFNLQTGVLATADTDSRIVLTNTHSENRKSTVRIDVGCINGIEWIGHYEILATGSDGCLHHYNMMDATSRKFPAHSASIAAVRKRGSLVFTGSVDGSVGIWDFRKKESVGSISHRMRGKCQPVKCLDAYDNYLYSSTIYQGRLWVWDLRNTSKRLGCIETEACQDLIELVRGNLYSASDMGILAVSPSLSGCEFIYRASNGTCAKGGMMYNKRYDCLVWTGRDVLCLNRIAEDSEEQVLGTAVQAVKGVAGMERCNDETFFVYTEEGAVSPVTLSYEL